RVLREQVLWVSGGSGAPPPPPPGPFPGPLPLRGGVHTFRVPLLAAPAGGALLACAEGRKRSAADVGAKIIALGATWGPTQVVADDGWVDGLSLGRLRAAPPARCCCAPDGGRSWGPPQNLSDVGEVFAPGPGSGIRKRLAPFPGRLVFCGHGTLERDGVSLLLSDDGGRSWHRGGVLPAIPFGAPAAMRHNGGAWPGVGGN
uniref:Exo-alpha-sialidase n=1 Tax=Geospiza parvula TaxID=87175 RepID=A0A8U8C3F8_GEOPR